MHLNNWKKKIKVRRSWSRQMLDISDFLAVLLCEADMCLQSSRQPGTSITTSLCCFGSQQKSWLQQAKQRAAVSRITIKWSFLVINLVPCELERETDTGSLSGVFFFFFSCSLVFSPCMVCSAVDRGCSPDTDTQAVCNVENPCDR